MPKRLKHFNATYRNTCNKSMSHHATTGLKRAKHVAPNDVSIRCVEMLRSFGRGSRCFIRLSQITEKSKKASL